MERLVLPVGPLQCNCYVLWEEPGHAVVIDPGDEGPTIVRALRSRGVTPRLILNTHGHFDHVGAVDALRDAFDSAYKIHRADLPVLTMIPARTKLWGLTVPEPPTPKEFVTPGERFDLAGLRFEALHTPGHTPGSTSYYFPDAHAVFTGDTLFQQSIGRTDFPLGDSALILESIRDRLLNLPPATSVHPGHGPPTTIEAESATNPFLS